MKSGKQRGLARLRAFCAALMLACAWVSSPVSLAAGPSDTCAMACCVEEGHCCCNPSRPFVLGQSSEGAERIGGSQFVQPCPEGCTAPQFSANIFLKAPIRPSAHLTERPAPAPGRSALDATANELLGSISSPPRAPPFSA